MRDSLFNCINNSKYKFSFEIFRDKNSFVIFTYKF